MYFFNEGKAKYSIGSTDEHVFFRLYRYSQKKNDCYREEREFVFSNEPMRRCLKWSRSF